ncbi:MAG TPA: hypothetical protein VF783_14520 [Terriglobales bacterium]
MNAGRQCARFVAVLVFACQVLGQAPPPSFSATPDASVKSWAFNLTVEGYLIPHQTSYANPDFMADRGRLHLEARYNNEDYRTGSLWIGYNFAAGKKLVLHVTPMIGGVFGRTNGVAPGCEASLTYKKVALSISNYFLINTSNLSSSFYYTWPQLTYTPVSWFRIGLVAQRNRIYHTGLDTQRGFFAGVSHKQFEFTTYIFNAGWTDPTVVLELGASF